MPYGIVTALLVSPKRLIVNTPGSEGSAALGSVAEMFTCWNPGGRVSVRAANKDVVYAKAIPRSVGVIKHINPEGDVAGDLREGRSQRNAHRGIRVEVI